MPSIEDWNALDVRVGTVLRAEPNPKARKPAYSMWIDFGDLGVLQSSAQITDRYTVDGLVGRQVVAVTGLPPRRIAGFRSDVLVLGALTSGGVILLTADVPVDSGTPVA